MGKDPDHKPEETKPQFGDSPRPATGSGSSDQPGGSTFAYTDDIVSAPPELPREGSTVSTYQILEQMGTGGMGVIYKALDTKLKRLVALKFLSPRLSRHQETLERFHREAESASALNHPHICTVHDVAEHDGRHFIVMELLDGKTMRDQIAGNPLPCQELMSFAIQIADALEAAHASGIMHRDIKPSNIFVTARGQIKVLDFGLAKLLDRPMTSPAREPLTRVGAVMGTIGYMSPEQTRGDPLDSRSDIFSFGAVLYEMATGVQPFRGKTSAMVFEAILHYWPSTPAAFNRDLPAGLDRIINKALEKDLKQRYQAVSELKSDLTRLKEKIDAGIVPPVAEMDRAVKDRQVKRRRMFTLGALSIVAILAEILAFHLIDLYRPSWQARTAAADAETHQRYLARIESASSPAEAVGLTQALQKLGQESQAFAALHRYLQKHPGAQEAHLAYATWLTGKQRFAEAAYQYDALLLANPDDLDAEVARARLSAWQKNYEEALDRFEKILQRHPGHYDARVGKAFTLLWMGRRSEAKPLLESALRDNPGDAEVARALKTF